MYRSPRYPTTAEQAEAFVATQRHGYLVATPTDGFPQLSILPFVKGGATIELHCVQEDPTFAALQANPHVTFFVGDFLAFSRHDWVDPADGGRATLNFRAVQYGCEATWSTDPADVAATLRRLLDRYEPEASLTPIEDGDFYGPRLRRLAALRLRVVESDAKFKVGPGAPDEVKRNVATQLRLRAEPGDAHAADLIEASLRGQG
jgi:predicted FMN-binding regulatory protein PaiB